jgi:hypothetical protein
MFVAIARDRQAKHCVCIRTLPPHLGRTPSVRLPADPPDGQAANAPHLTRPPTIMAKAKQDQEKTTGAKSTSTKGRSTTKKSTASSDGSAAEAQKEKSPRRQTRAKSEGTTAKKTTASRKGRGGAKAEPTHEEVSRRAYEIYEARGGQHGRSEEDWAEAERQLRGS